MSPQAKLDWRYSTHKRDVQEMVNCIGEREYTSANKAAELFPRCIHTSPTDLDMERDL